MSRHKMDITRDQLITAIIVKYGGEMEITGDDIDKARGQILGIKVDEESIHLKSLTRSEATLLGFNDGGVPN